MVSLPTYQELDRIVGRAELVRPLMNLWPPFLAAGIRITHWSRDFRHVKVTLRHRRLSANYLGTLYGASLFSMTDPFWVMMIGRALGPDYQVWDKSADIDFIKPGRSHVYAEFTLTERVLDEIRSATMDGDKHFHWFSTDITTSDGTLIARIRKQVYVRKRPQTC